MAARDVEGWMKSARFILGCYNVEDLIQIPGTRWIVGGGVTTYAAAMADQVITKNYLHVFNADTETVRRVEPEDIAIRADAAPIREALRRTGRSSVRTASASGRETATLSPYTL